MIPQGARQARTSRARNAVGLLVPLRVGFQHPPRPLPSGRDAAHDAGRERPLPTIALVTPALNAARFIGETIDSVLAQRYDGLSYVIVDGGSVDETVQIARRPRLDALEVLTGPDAGQGDAINRGHAQATGEIMGWLNADDLLLPGALHTVGAFFAEHLDVDVMYGYRLLIDEKSQWVGSWVTPRHGRSSFAIANFIPQETMFWRRSIWDAVGGLDPRFEFAMDWDLILRFAGAGARFHRIAVPLGAFRLHAAQKSQRLIAVGKAEAALLRQITHGREIPKIERLVRLLPFLLRATACHYIDLPARARALARG